jgi:hypothetical protein
MQSDWKDGYLLCKLATKYGAYIPEFPSLDRKQAELNCTKSLDACQQLNVESYVTAKELAEIDAESIGLMATLVQFIYAKPIKNFNENIKVYLIDTASDGIINKHVGENFGVFKIKL